MLDVMPDVPSHCSGDPGPSTPFPQYPPWVSVSLHDVEQLEHVDPYSALLHAVPFPGPRSHSSTALKSFPSPHTLFVHTLVQASVSSRLPSSHCSPSFTWPSPHHTDGWQMLQSLNVHLSLPILAHARDRTKT